MSSRGKTGRESGGRTEGQTRLSRRVPGGRCSRQFSRQHAGEEEKEVLRGRRTGRLAVSDLLSRRPTNGAGSIEGERESRGVARLASASLLKSHEQPAPSVGETPSEQCRDRQW